MQLAQFNVARLRAPADDPAIADFVAGIAPVNALADGAPGFVWRWDAGQPTPARRVIVNLSVWESIAALRAFTYGGLHLDFVRRRRDWFERMDVFLAMWWVPDGDHPTPADGWERLRMLRRDGSTARAFTFSATFEADGTPSQPRQWPPHTPRR